MGTQICDRGALLITGSWLRKAKPLSTGLTGHPPCSLGMHSSGQTRVLPDIPQTKGPDSSKLSSFFWRTPSFTCLWGGGVRSKETQVHLWLMILEGKVWRPPTSSYLCMFKSLNVGPICIIFSLSPHLSVNFSNTVIAITLGDLPKTARPPAQWLMAVSVVSLCPRLVHLSTWCMGLWRRPAPCQSRLLCCSAAGRKCWERQGPILLPVMGMILKPSWRLSQSAWVVSDLQS